MSKRKWKQTLLVSVRGANEAVAAATGGCGIADVEYPASALGTPYPLNIRGVRDRLDKAGFRRLPVSTNIGEVQSVRASACQAALGVAVAGANLVKFGLAEQTLESAAYLAEGIVRTVRELGPPGKLLFPAVFVDKDMKRFFNPFKDGASLVQRSKADGLLIDTFNKAIGKGLLDLCSVEDIRRLTGALHRMGKQSWIAGSITRDELAELWKTGVDVICVRGAACSKDKGKGRFGEVETAIVKTLVATVPA